MQRQQTRAQQEKSLAMAKQLTPVIERPIQSKGLLGIVQRAARSFREMVSDIFYLMIL